MALYIDARTAVRLGFNRLLLYRAYREECALHERHAFLAVYLSCVPVVRIKLVDAFNVC